MLHLNMINSTKQTLPSSLLEYQVVLAPEVSPPLLRLLHDLLPPLLYTPVRNLPYAPLDALYQLHSYIPLRQLEGLLHHVVAVGVPDCVYNGQPYPYCIISPNELTRRSTHSASRGWLSPGTSLSRWMKTSKCSTNIPSTATSRRSTHTTQSPNTTAPLSLHSSHKDSALSPPLTHLFYSSTFMLNLLFLYIESTS